MNKSPATLLQEICLKLKKGVTPHYELIHDGINTDKIFTYEVTAFNLTAEGSGRSKKV